MERNSFTAHMENVNSPSWTRGWGQQELCSITHASLASCVKHLDTHMTDTEENSAGTCVLEVRGGLQCSVHTDRYLKDNYIFFPSIKLNCPNNGMACSQQYCCVLLRTIIELTVHFSTGGWNIKFDQILVLLLLHFASLPVFLVDRWVCDHRTVTESHSCGRRLPWSWVWNLCCRL